MSTLSSRRCVANEWRSVWQWTFGKLALFAAEDIIFCKFRVDSFPFLPENMCSWDSFFCFSAWSFSSSNKNSGILKILSLFPFACLMCPIFSGKFRSIIFRLTSSETRNPQAYIRLAINFDFSVLRASSNFFISSLDRVVGRCLSFLGRLIEAVGSFWKIAWLAYLIAAKNRIVELADLSDNFSAMNCLMSSVAILSGDFSEKFRRSLLAWR